MNYGQSNGIASRAVESEANIKSCTAAPEPLLARLSARADYAHHLAERLESKMNFIDGCEPPYGEDASNESGFLESLDQRFGGALDRLDRQIRRLERIVG